MKLTLQKTRQAIALFGLAFYAFNANAVDTVWAVDLKADGVIADAVWDVIEYDDSLFVRYTRDIAYHAFPTLSRYSKEGGLEWRILNANEELLYSANINLINDQGIFCAQSTGGGLVKLDHSGNTQWVVDLTESYPGSFRSIDLREVAGDETGLYITAQVKGASEGGAIIHTDYSGNVVWVTPVETDNWGMNDIVLDGDVIYVSHSNDVHRYSIDGEQLTSVDTPIAFSGNHPLYNLTVYAGAVYATFARDGSRIAKFDSTGALVWESTVFSDDLYNETTGLVVNEEGIFISGSADMNGAGERAPVIARHNHDGDLEAIKVLETPFEFRLLGTGGSSNLVISDDRFFLGISSEHNSHLTEVIFDGAALAPVTASSAPTAALSLGDINSDSAQDIAVLVSGGDAPVVQVTSVGDSAATSHSITFTSPGDAADIVVLDDQNSNGAPELALLTSDTPTVEVRDSLSGDLLTTLEFNSNFTSVKIKAIADQNNNGAQEIALLANSGENKLAVVRDSQSGAKISAAYFNPNYEVKDLAVVEDLNGDTQPELAVLSTNTSGISKFEIRTQAGAMLKNIWLGKAYESTQLLTLPYTADYQFTPAAALGALQTRVNGDGLAVRVMDTLTGSEISSVGYNWQFSPTAAAVIGGTAANGKIAVLGSDDTNTKIEIRDAYSGALVKNIWLGESLTPMGITTLPDANGNGEVETATLVEQGDAYYLVVRDSLSGELIDKIAVSVD